MNEQYSMIDVHTSFDNPPRKGYYALDGVFGVIVASYSPRRSGERAAYSKWIEVPSQELVCDFQYRYNYIMLLRCTPEIGRIWVKPATVGGRFRLFYTLSADTGIIN